MDNTKTIEAVRHFVAHKMYLFRSLKYLKSLHEKDLKGGCVAIFSP
jgi:hypothetical protein